MSYKSIGYHTRLYGDTTKKISGGSFGEAIDMETINRLVSAHFRVSIEPSGTPVFVDRQGREIRLTIAVDPKVTEMGKVAIAAHNREKLIERERLQDIEDSNQQEIEYLLDGLTHDEIVRRLREN